MASRLNLLFQSAPRQFLQQTVLFSDELALSRMRRGITHHFDLQPMKERATVRVLDSLHLYTDTPLTSYYVAPGASAIIPKADSAFRFVFLPEFTASRVLIRPEGGEYLRVECEGGLAGRVPPAEADPGSPYVDSFCYWDQIYGDLVGTIRATAVLVKEPGQPWTAMMQQIVGTAGFEQVRMLFSQPLRY